MTPVEQQQNDIGERAGAQATADGEVNLIAEAPALPLFVIEVARHLRSSAFAVSATAAVGADKQVALLAGDVDHLSIGTKNEIAGQRDPSASPFGRGLR